MQSINKSFVIPHRKDMPPLRVDSETTCQHLITLTFKVDVKIALQNCIKDFMPSAHAYWDICLQAFNFFNKIGETRLNQIGLLSRNHYCMSKF